MNNPKWNLAEAVQAILDSGVTPTDLSHELGFQDTSMVYRYRLGTTKTTSALRALILFNEYDMLLDEYVSEEHLKTKAEAEMSKGMDKLDTCGHILDKLLVIASYKGANLRQRLLRLIADLDKRN